MLFDLSRAEDKDWDSFWDSRDDQVLYIVESSKADTVGSGMGKFCAEVMLLYLYPIVVASCGAETVIAGACLTSSFVIAKNGTYWSSSIGEIGVIVLRLRSDIELWIKVPDTLLIL